MNGTFTKIIRSSGKFIKRHAADIFAVITGIGVIATGMSAYNAGKQSVLQDESDTSDAEQEKKRSDVLALPIAIAAGTISADILSRYFGRKAEKQALAACAALSAYIARMERHRDSDKSECTDTGDQTHKPRTVHSGDTSIEDTGLGNIIFTEEFTGRRFKSSVEAVVDAMERAHEIYKNAGFIDLNEVYELFNISQTDAGEILGWSVNMQILDPYLGETSYDQMVDAYADMCIYLVPEDDRHISIYYKVLPVGGLAGVGPCNY